MTWQKKAENQRIACALSIVVKGTFVIAKIIALRQRKWYRNLPPIWRTSIPYLFALRMVVNSPFTGTSTLTLIHCWTVLSNSAMCTIYLSDFVVLRHLVHETEAWGVKTFATYIPRLVHFGSWTTIVSKLPLKLPSFKWLFLCCFLDSWTWEFSGLLFLVVMCSGSNIM